jgi:hypothetical protein
VRGRLVILAAIGFLACQPPQSIDRAVNDGTNVSRSSGGASGARGSGGRAGPIDDGAGSGSGGASNPDPGMPDAAAPDFDGGTPPSGSGAVTPTPPAPVGQACTANEGCASGACVDGLCCNTTCAGACQACDIAGHEGTCTPVPKGQDPDDECAMDPPASCKLDGTCDGQGACAHYAVGAECMPGTCAAGVEHAGGSCNGQGQCLAGATQACKSGVCDGSSCGNACTAHAQCQPGFFCDTGTCRVKLAAAAVCASDPQCASGHCVDKVCCATDCTQGCYACNLTGSVGSCVAIADGQDPDKECVAEPATTCGHAGGCNGRGACKQHPAGTACGAGACTNAVETSARTCNGTGTCQVATTKSCGDFVCKGAVCANRCAGDADCKMGLFCNAGACGATPPPPASKIDTLKVNDTANAGGWSAQKNFQIGTGGVRPWSDWPNSYVSAMDAGASVLVGADWVKVAAESKKFNNGPQATLTLKAAADVYLAVDDRWGDMPAWLAGWTNTGIKIRVTESATKTFPFTLYVKKAQTGTIALPAINNNDGYDYFVVVK